MNPTTETDRINDQGKTILSITEKTKNSITEGETMGAETMAEKELTGKT